MEEKRKKMEKKYSEILKVSKEEKLKIKKKFEEVQKRRNKIEEEKLVTDCMSGDKNARSKLIEHNLRLVAHIVKKYNRRRKT